MENGDWLGDYLAYRVGGCSRPGEHLCNRIKKNNPTFSEGLLLEKKAAIFTPEAYTELSHLNV